MLAIFRNNNARSRKIPGPGRLHPNDDNVAQARGPKIRPKLGVSCRRLTSCKPFTKEKHSTDSNASLSYHACVYVLLCTSCKPFTKEKHSTDSNASLSYHACVCVLLCTSGKHFYKKSILPIATHRYNALNACVCACVYFCNIL